MMGEGKLEHKSESEKTMEKEKIEKNPISKTNNE